MLSSEEFVEFEGANSFRIRLALSCIVGRPVKIRNIRCSPAEYGDNPGLRPHEVNILKLLDSLLDGSSVSIDDTHTSLTFRPGLLVGCDHPVVHKCAKERGIIYYLEFLMALAPFMKHPLDITLLGVTDHPDDATTSIDCFKVVIVNLAKKIGLSLPITVTVKHRGILPIGGGEVHLTCGILKNVAPFQVTYPGRITRVRGSIWSVNAATPFSTRTYTAARRVLNKLLADVWIYTDPPISKPTAKSSHAYGLSLVAETMKGCQYSASAMFDSSRDDKEEGKENTPDVLGETVACRLLAEIVEGGVADSSFQWFILWFMALADDYKPSRVVLGRLTHQSVLLLQHIRRYLNIKFICQTYEEAEQFAAQGGSPDSIEPSPEHDTNVEGDITECDDRDDQEKSEIDFEEESQKIEELRVHNRVVITCFGSSIPNLARQTF